MIGEVEERVWTLIAADPPEDVGRRERERRARFAFRQEAEDWIAEQEREGFVCEDRVAPLATSYHGPTDSPSNAWSARVTQAVEA